MNGIAVAMGEGVEGRLSFRDPACRTSILACRQKVTPTVYHPAMRRNPATTNTILERFGSLTVARISTAMSSPLEGCVGSLRSSMQLLDSSINILAEGVNDFPRLAKVLQTTRVSSDSLSISLDLAKLQTAL
jgi:hypothetical protein